VRPDEQLVEVAVAGHQALVQHAVAAPLQRPAQDLGHALLAAQAPPPDAGGPVGPVELQSAAAAGDDPQHHTEQRGDDVSADD